MRQQLELGRKRGSSKGDEEMAFEVRELRDHGGLEVR